MSGRWLAIGGVVLAVVIVVAGVSTYFATRNGSGTGSGSSGTTTTSAAGAQAPRQLSRAGYQKLWALTAVGAAQGKTLKSWPVPYQQYIDSSANNCYEWWDHVQLYNLCFKKGLLLTKDMT